MLDVMDCATQQASQMTMKDWEEYYFKEKEGDSGERKRVLNVISLEFSSTKLDAMVEGPKVVRQIDWTDNIWPRNLKEDQKEVEISYMLYYIDYRSYRLNRHRLCKYLLKFDSLYF